MNISVPHLRAKVKDVVHSPEATSDVVDLKSLSVVALAANTAAFAELNSVWNKYLGRNISTLVEVLKEK
jgi:hypothetical protein